MVTIASLMPARVAIFVAGALLVAATVSSTMRTLVVPRGLPSRITRLVFNLVRIPFNLRSRPTRAWPRRDLTMAFFAPVALFVLLAAWLGCIVLGYTAMAWGLSHHSLREAVELSGSSVFTLGTRGAADLPTSLLTYTEAGLGPLLLALLITYLPSMYSAFSRREALVASLEVWADAPPSALIFVERLTRIRGLDNLTDLWERWNRWFTELKESHTTLPAVGFFRSPDPRQSWVTAAGALLDTAAIMVSTLERPNDPDAQLCLRAGWLSLRTVAAYFGIGFDADPAPGDPISIRREEYDRLYDQLRDVGAPVKQDREQAWRDYAGWRVNYDKPLVALAALVMAPESPWSSDRALTREPVWWRPWRRAEPTVFDTGLS